MNKHTIFLIKPDAIIRGLRETIKEDINKHYEIVIEEDHEISLETALKLRGHEWKTRWNLSPIREQKEFCIANEVGNTVVLLCRIREEVDTIQFSK